MSTETEALRQFFAAINRNDMQAITEYFDPEIVRIEPEGFPTAGIYRGISESAGARRERTRDLGRRDLRAREVPGKWGQSCRIPPCPGPSKRLDRMGWRTICRWLRVSQRQDHPIPVVRRTGGGTEWAGRVLARKLVYVARVQTDR